MPSRKSLIGKMVPRSRLAVRSWCCIVATLTAGIASAQTYPIKPVRIVTSEPGGSNDFAARVVAQELSVALGQQVIVENRPAGIIPGEIVSRAAPDGYTLLFIGSSFWVGPLMQKTPYDPVKDFAPVSLVNRAPTILVVHPSLPARFVQRLTDEIVKALARPDVKEKFFKAGVEVVGSSPDQLVATMKNDASRFGKVIKVSGIRLE